MMKLRKIISAVLSLIMTFMALPINKIMAQETKINEYMFLYDAESNTNGVVPDSLSKDNFEIKNYAKKGNSLKLLKSNTANIPMKTINKGRAIFEIEMRPENEAVQNVIFKNSEGKNLFVIAAKANNADLLNTKALYIAKEKVKKQVEGENTSEIVNISNSSPAKSWIKLKVEFNFDETKYSENNILYYDISASSTQESDYTSKWTDGGHITQQNIIDIGSTVSDSVYKNGTVENIEIFDLSSISMWATSSKFIGDISLKNEYLVAKSNGTQKLGQEFDVSLIELKKVYNDGTEAAEAENSEIISLETLESKEYEIINFDKNKNGKQNIIIKYDGLYAPVTIEVTGNSTGTESENIIFSYDGENNENHTLPKELSNLQIYEKDGKYGYAGKDNALRFKESKKITNIPINGTINKNTAVFELEMYPGGKTTQNVVFKNSEGKILFVIGNDTNDGKTGSYYISNDVPDKVGDEEKIEKILTLREFTKKTWVKLKVEIDFTNSSNGVLKYKISTSTSPNADKYDKSVDNWTDVLEVTQDKLIDKGYTNGTVSTDISKLDLESIEFYPIEKQFIGDISLKILESEEITLKNTIVDKENKVTKTRYKIGENLSLAIKEEYSDGSTKTITDMAYIKNNYDISGFDTNTLGKQKITLTHKIKSDIVIELEVEVIEVTITGINVEQGEVKTAYKAGEKIDVSNIVVKALYDGGSIPLGSDEYVAVPSIETAVTGISQITVTVTAKGHKAECTYDITVEEVKLTKITISKEKLFHRVGEKLEKGDLKVKGTFAFSDGTGTSTRELEESEFELGEFDSTEIGMKKVKVRAGDVEDSVNIIVVIPSTTKMLYNLFKYTQAEEKEGQTAGDLGILSGAEIVTVSDGIKENTTQMLEVSGKAEKKMDISISEGVVKIITVFNQNSKDVSYKIMDKDGNTLISISQPFEIKEEKEKGVLRLVEENPTDGEKGYLEKDNLVNRWIKLETEIDLDKSNSSGVLNFLTKIYQKKNYTDEWTEKNFVSTTNYQESSFKNDNGCATAGITEFNVGSVIFGASEASVYFDDIEISATDFPKPVEVNIKVRPNKLNYNKGEVVNLSGLVITETYSNGESRDISDLDYIKKYYLVSELNATYEKQTVTLRYKTNQEISAKFDVIVDLSVELTEIKVEVLKKEYFIGDKILASDIKVKAVYNNDKEKLLLAEDYKILCEILETAGNIEITIISGEKTAKFTVNVKDFVESVKITKLPEKTEYMAGDKIDFLGIQVTAVYKSGKESILERTAYKIDSDIKEVKSDTKSINVVIKLNNEKGTEVKAEESYSITVKAMEEKPNIPNEPEKPSDDEDSESTDDENSNDNLNVEENLKLDGDIIDKIMENLDNFSENKIFEFVVNDKLELFKEAVNKLAEAGKDLKIKLKGTDIILNNKFLYSNGIKNNLNITIDKLSENELKDIKKQIKLDDTLEYIQSDKISIKSEGNEVDLTNKEPLTVVVKIAEIDDADKLTAIRYEKQEDGSFKVVKIGGVYDKNTQTFTYHIDKTGIIAIVKAENTKQINLTIGNNKMIVNGKEFVNDISPIVENNRTYLPIRVIAEKLGAKVSWEQETQSVTVTLDGKTLRFNVNEEITGYGNPIVKNQRTLVPVRYISEKLGANVLWIPSLNEVEIVK